MKNRAAIIRRLLCWLLALHMTALLAGCGGEHYRPNAGANLAQTPFRVEAAEGADPAEAAELALPFNAVYRLFGGSDPESCLVFRFGNEPTYFEWMALKIAWTADEAYLGELRDKLLRFPQTDNGFLWSWGDSVYWPTGKGEMHYDGLFRFVAAVDEILRWTGDAAFLETRDPDTVGEDRALDASEGRTVYEKCAAAMAYAARELDGENGLITLTERAAYLADGKTRFDRNREGELLWNNTGRAESASSNYWDNLCFGHRDAYETALYYHALGAMRGIEFARGDTAAAARCAAMAETVKTAFNKTFWDEEKGRYIACVDADGKRWDPGLTFLNTEALAYGLGDEEKAARIFAWLDGERAVPGDTLQGRDVTDYAGVLNRAFGKKVVRGSLPFAPVSNTVSIEALSGDGAPWWFSLEGAINVGEGQNAAFGKHLENGGYLFFPLYYELTARTRYLGAESTAKRARELAAVYRFNGFDSDVGGWVEGLTGEFPENGIVSRVFLSSLAGINAQTDALTVAPRLPAGAAALEIDALRYRGAVLSARVEADGVSLTAETPMAGTLRFYPAAPGAYRVLLTGEDGNDRAAESETDADGALTVDLNGALRAIINKA